LAKAPEKHVALSASGVVFKERLRSSMTMVMLAVAAAVVTALRVLANRAMDSVAPWESTDAESPSR